MKKGGPAPAAKGQKHETVGGSTSTQPKSHDPSLTKPEIVTIVEKTVSEALARQRSELQAEITKSTKQQVQDVSDRLLELRDKSVDADAKNVQSAKEVEGALTDLKKRVGLIEKLVKEELDGIVEEKVRLILRKIHPDSETEEDKKKWSEQLARSDAAHQEEIQKLHQQHHQDMLSVINDCCRKLKSSFTRQNKPYNVSEIHITIDDVEQKMIREILSEIEKTDTHEDLSSFGEVLATSGSSHEVGQSREFTRLSSDEIAASLDAFDVENLTSFSQDLESISDAVAAADAEREPVVEENISVSKSMMTGDRGNVYYTEELKRTIDDMIALGNPTGVSPNETEPAPDLPPKTTRTQSEVEASLEDLIMSGDAASRLEADVENLMSRDLDERDSAVAFKDPKVGGQSKTSEVLPETTGLDLDQLKSLEALSEGDFSWAEIQPSSKVEPEESKSHETFIKPASTASAPLSQGHGQVKPIEGKREQDQSAKSVLDRNQLKSLEAKAEGDFSWTEIQPSSKVEPKVSKSHETVTKPATTASATSPQGKTSKDQSAESVKDRDQMKALEEMLEAQMTDSLDAVGGNVSQGLIEPTKSAKPQVKSNVSEQVTSSALPTTETIKATPRTGYGENPHYVEEVLSATASKAKDKP